MSFGGPPPTMLPPSGPFEATMTKIGSSPYALAGAMFLMNIGARFLPLEVTKGQEQFLNQPWFRRFIIFTIFFLATRNIITAGWLSLVVILCVGYLFNENSSLCIFGKGGMGSCKTKGATETLALTPEEQAILKNLQDKAARIADMNKKPEVNTKITSPSHEKYQKALHGLWA